MSKKHNSSDSVEEEMSNSSNKQARTEEVSPFDGMGDDLLRTILLRTNASDHLALKRTCRRFCTILNSPLFRQERSEQGFAEVSVRKLSSFEIYSRNKKEDRDEAEPDENDDEFLTTYDHLGEVLEYGDNSFMACDFEIFVDGLPLHNCREDNYLPSGTRFQLNVRVLQRGYDNFYGVCDCYNSTMVTMGTELFTNNGFPKVASLRKAMAAADDTTPVLFIEDFELPFEYRSTASTVGPTILQKLLNDVFQDEYSYAIYMPFGSLQYTQEDIDNVLKERCADPHAFLNSTREVDDEEILNNERKFERDQTLKRKNMRQFFRAGFHQVDDPSIVHGSEYSYVFCTPETAAEPLLTEEEALTRPIASPERVRPKLGLARKLFQLTKKRCSCFKNLKEEAEKFKKPPEEHPLFADTMNQMLQLRQKMDQAENLLQGRGMSMLGLLGFSGNSELQSMRQQINESYETIQRGYKDAADNANEKLALDSIEFLHDVMAILSKAVDNKDWYNIILESAAVHQCVAYQNLTYIHKLIELLPEDQQKIGALNNFDENGCTPLMVAAVMGQDKDIMDTCEFVEALLGLGADTNVTDKAGKSALGHCWSKRNDIAAFYTTFGIVNPNQNQVGYERLEALLTPDQGATPADEEVKLQGEDE